MADAALSAVIGAVTEELISLIPMLSGFGKTNQQIREWLELLSEVRDVVKDHEEMKYRNCELISWHQDLRTLAEDIHDAVADLREVEKLGILSRMKMVLKPDSTIEEELKAITRRFQHIYKRKMMLDKDKEREKKRTKAMSGSASAVPRLFGRKSEIEKIFDLLERPSHGDYEFSFISIVGMGGIGKTTLAQHVYNDDRAASFPFRAWCCVSMDFNHCTIYRSIIEQLTGKCDVHDSSAMIEKLRRELKGKKFLIVLDNYWSESVHDFNALCAPFMTAKTGSIFIITTRDRAVAKRIAGDKRIIDLGVMSNKDCWSLFCSGSRLEANSTSNLVTIAKEICEKCDGLPLAIAIMKGMLSGIDDEAIWRAILNDLVSGEVCDVDSIIRMSYENLSDQLKKCFSFCTIFPKSHQFERKRMVDLWICAEIVECNNQLT